MRFFFFFISLSFFSQLSAQQEPGCKTNLFLDARLDTVVYDRKKDPSIKRDTSSKRVKPSGFIDYAPYQRLFYVLKPPVDAYKILSFTISAEDGEGFINFLECYGDTIRQNGLRVLQQRLRDKPVHFTCIKVRHSNGMVFTLKDLSVIVSPAILYDFDND